MSQYSKQQVIKNYEMLNNQDSETRERANLFLLHISECDQAWTLSEKMITEISNHNYQLLGAQILYQKIFNELSGLSLPFRQQLKQFLLNKIDGSVMVYVPIVDRLASSLALIGCTLLLDHWPTFLEDMTAFMVKSKQNLKNGLIVLERIPNELLLTNRIAQGIKRQIREALLSKVQLIASIFQSVLQLQDKNTDLVFQTLQSWIKFQFPIMKYPNMIEALLKLIIQNTQFLQTGGKVLCEALRHTSISKFPNLDKINPVQQRVGYSEEQLWSLKLIVQFVEIQRGKYMNINNFDADTAQVYGSIVGRILLSYSFILLQQKGFVLLTILFQILNNKDLKLSYFTFQFWCDFCMQASTMTIQQSVVGQMNMVIEELWRVLCKKVQLETQQLVEVDCKEDETIDDICQMTFNQYRKHAQDVFKAIYEYLKMRQKNGSKVFFGWVNAMVQEDAKNDQVGLWTELALFCARAVYESMTSQAQQANNLCLLQIVMAQQNRLIPKHPNIPTRIISLTLNLIKDNAQQISKFDTFFLDCLRYVLRYIDNDVLCHNSAGSFQGLLEAKKEIVDSMLIADLLELYQNKQFTKQVIFQTTFEGIVSGLVKMKDYGKAEEYIIMIMAGIVGKYRLARERGGQGLLMCLIELKLLLNCYLDARTTFKDMFRVQFVKIAGQALTIGCNTLAECLARGVKYSNTNELGLSVVVCKNTLHFADLTLLPGYINMLNSAASILTIQRVRQYYPLLDLITATLQQFTGRIQVQIDHWLLNLPHITKFMLQYIGQSRSLDPDILRHLFAIHQHTMLYNMNMFISFIQRQAVLDAALHCLLVVNQRNLQRKLFSCIYLCVNNHAVYGHKYLFVLENVIAALPIITVLSVNTVSRVLICLLGQMELNGKQEILKQHFDKSGYANINPIVKGILVKLLAFAIETRLQRNIKATLIDIIEICLKRQKPELAMQLELRLNSWKRQFANRSKKN